MGKLTVLKARSNLKPGMYGDGGTLFLRVFPGGSRSWVQRLTINGKRTDLGLGGFPLVSLVEARDMAFENRRLARRGGDPLAAKRKPGVPTFREAARRTHEANLSRWRNAKHAASWMQTLERHALPRLGEMRVDRIGREDVLAVLTPIWSSRAETGRRVRQRIRAVLSWCQAHGHVTGDNVAGESIDGALPSQPKVQAHQRALDYREVAGALEAVEGSAASLAAKLAFRFLVLCASRSGEVRGALWSEIDIEARTWTVPGSRMKGGQDHVVPLTDAAVEVLERARPLRDPSDLLFPSPMKKGKPLSDMTLVKVCRDLHFDCVPHGFRSSFRTWASEKTSAEHAVMEMSLAHAVGSAVERSYARSDLLAKRQALLQRWVDYLTGESGKVVNLHG